MRQMSADGAADLRSESRSVGSHQPRMRSQLCDKVRLGCGRSPRQVDRDLFPSAVITTATELVKSWPATVSGGGLMSYYRLTIESHRAASLDSTEAPPRTSLQEISPSRFRHAMATADAIVHTLAACHERGVKVQRAIGDGRLTLHPPLRNEEQSLRT